MLRAMTRGSLQPSRLVIAALIATPFLAAGCGGSKSTTTTVRRDSATNSSPTTSAIDQQLAQCARRIREGRPCAPPQHNGVCGSPIASPDCIALSFDDLPAAFGAWPQVKSVYRLADRYDVYTTLPATAGDQAANICVSVFEDVLGGRPPRVPANREPLIIVWSGGGPATTEPLATGASVGVGCTSIE
jgi:hypothetical protein